MKIWSVWALPATLGHLKKAIFRSIYFREKLKAPVSIEKDIKSNHKWKIRDHIDARSPIELQSLIISLVTPDVQTEENIERVLGTYEHRERRVEISV